MNDTTPAAHGGGRSWAWGVTAAYLIFAGLTLTMVAIAVSQRTDLVSADYYQREIDYQQHIEGRARSQALPAGVAWSFRHEDGDLVLRFPPGHFADAPQGQVHLYRPDNASLDRHYTIALDGFGDQRIPLAELATGRWQVRIEWRAGGEQYYSERDLQVGT
ncbi:MAG: FixH family protein [bacterium]|nr:FixH family protein [bacterium]